MGTTRTKFSPDFKVKVALAAIRGKTTQIKKREDFQSFMDEIVADYPPTQEIHVILDNLSTHKKNEAWLAEHPNVTFHFTPTSDSWLTQVEIWFGILGRKALAGASQLYEPGAIDQGH